MPFRFQRKRQNSLRPVNRIKHVVDRQIGIGLGVRDTSDLAEAVDAPVIANTTEVQTGCTINGIFLVVEVYATTSAALSNVYMMIVKNPGSQLTFVNPNVIGGSTMKKFVIHQEMVMLQRVTNSNPRTLFKGVIVIPRHMRRFAPDDKLQMALFSPGVNIDACFQCHYKEFR